MPQKKATTLVQIAAQNRVHDPKKSQRILKKLRKEREKRADKARADKLAAARRPPMWFGPLK